MFNKVKMHSGYNEEGEYELQRVEKLNGSKLSPEELKEHNLLVEHIIAVRQLRQEESCLDIKII